MKIGRRSCPQTVGGGEGGRNARVNGFEGDLTVAVEAGVKAEVVVDDTVDLLVVLVVVVLDVTMKAVGSALLVDGLIVLIVVVDTFIDSLNQHQLKRLHAMFYLMNVVLLSGYYYILVIISSIATLFRNTN